MFAFASVVASTPIPPPLDLTAVLGPVLSAAMLVVLVVAAWAIVHDALSFGRQVVRTGTQVRRLRSVQPGLPAASRSQKQPPLAA